MTTTLWRLPGYNEIPILILGRTFKALLLPILKDLIRGRFRSSGYPSISSIIKEKHFEDMMPNSQHKFCFDEYNDFRFMLKVVSRNQINCFTEKEAALSEQLRKYGNQFAHDAEFEPRFVFNVLELTRELLIEVNKNKYNKHCEASSW